jgi:cytochrome c oxidase subunit IV
MAHSGDGVKWKRLGDGTLPCEDQDEGLGHIVPVHIYTATFMTLLLLTFVTVWAATQHFGILNLFIALAVATVKAAIVTLYFMHLNWESKVYWGIVIYPIFIFMLILGSTLGDNMLKKSGSGAPLALDARFRAEYPDFGAPRGVAQQHDERGLGASHVGTDPGLHDTNHGGH